MGRRASRRRGIFDRRAFAEATFNSLQTFGGIPGRGHVDGDPDVGIQRRTRVRGCLLQADFSEPRRRRPRAGWISTGGGFYLTADPLIRSSIALETRRLPEAHKRAVKRGDVADFDGTIFGAGCAQVNVQVG